MTHRPSANQWSSSIFGVTLVATKRGAKPICAPYVYETQAQLDAEKLRALGYEAEVRPYEQGDAPSYEEG